MTRLMVTDPASNRKRPAKPYLMTVKSTFLAPLLLAAPQLGSAAILYTTGLTSPAAPGDFDITASGNASDVGWRSVMGRANYHLAADKDGINRRTGLINGNDASNTLNDYLYFQNISAAASDMDYFAHTSTGSNFSAFSPSQYSTLNAGWLVNRDGFATNGGYYLAMQSGGVWYASTTNAAPQGTSGSITINLLTSEWVTINEIANVSLGRGTTTFTYGQLFSSGQQITGVGFYVDDLSAAPSSGDPPVAAYRTLRIDNFAISGEAIPEAGSSMLALTGLGGFLLRRRR